MRNATAVRANYCSSGENLTQNNFVTDFQVREEFSCLVIPFTKHQLAEIAGVQPQAAALWHRAERTPSAPTIFNLAQSIPSVQEWVARRSGMDRAVQAGSWDVWIQGLYHVAAHDQRAREALRLLEAANLIPKYSLGELSRDPLVRDALKLIDKRLARVRENDRAAAERCEEIAREIEAEFGKGGEP